MANTTNPVSNTHQLQRILPNKEGIIYGQNESIARYNNCFPVVSKEHASDPTHMVVRRPPVTTTGATLSVAVNNGYGRISPVIFVNNWDGVSPTIWYTREYLSGAFFLYRVMRFSDAGKVEITVNLPDVPVAMGEYRVDAVQYTMILATINNNSSVYYIPGENTAITATYAFPGGITVSDLIVMDSLLFVASSYDTSSGSAQRIYNSNISDPTNFTTTTDFIDCEMEADAEIRRLAKHHNHLVAFGSRSIEFFYNKGIDIGSPLERQASYAQNIGIYRNTYVAAANDTIYFIGAFNDAVEGLYVLDNFKVTKISDAYFDRWIDRNAGTGVTMTMMPYMLNGEICALIQMGSRVNSPVSWNHIVYIPSLRTFVEMDFQQNFIGGAVIGSYYGTPGTMLVPSSLTTANGSLWWSGDQDFSLTNVAMTDADETFTATINTDYEDFNNNSYKHIKHVDALGEYDDNVLTLSYSKDLNFGNYTTMDTRTQTVNGEQYPLRWRNLGRSYKSSYQLEITGNKYFTYRGLEVAYNQGTR